MAAGGVVIVVPGVVEAAGFFASSEAAIGIEPTLEKEFSRAAYSAVYMRI